MWLAALRIAPKDGERATLRPWRSPPSSLTLGATHSLPPTCPDSELYSCHDEQTCFRILTRAAFVVHHAVNSQHTQPHARAREQGKQPRHAMPFAARPRHARSNVEAPTCSWRAPRMQRAHPISHLNMRRTQLTPSQPGVARRHSHSHGRRQSPDGAELG